MADPNETNGNTDGDKCPECGFVSRYGRENYHSFDCSKNPDFISKQPTPTIEVEEVVREFQKKTELKYEILDIPRQPVGNREQWIAADVKELRDILTQLATQEKAKREEMVKKIEALKEIDNDCHHGPSDSCDMNCVHQNINRTINSALESAIRIIQSH